MNKGLFITIEGIDGSGKSTQAEMLCEWLKAEKKRDVLRTFEPGDWEGGAAIRQLLLGGTNLTPRTELLLFLADRSGHLAKVAPALESGRCVVCERYNDSTLAYQSWGRDIAFDEINGLLSQCRFPAPDVTILLNIDAEAANARLMKRGAPDRMESGGIDFIGRVARGYRELAARNPERIIVIDASPDAARVAAEIREELEKLPALA